MGGRERALSAEMVGLDQAQEEREKTHAETQTEGDAEDDGEDEEKEFHGGRGFVS